MNNRQTGATGEVPAGVDTRFDAHNAKRLRLRRSLSRRAAIETATIGVALLGVGHRSSDVGKLGVDRAAKSRRANDNGESDQSADQSVFDCSCAGLVLHETSKKVLHSLLRLNTGLSKLQVASPGVWSGDLAMA